MLVCSQFQADPSYVSQAMNPSIYFTVPNLSHLKSHDGQNQIFI